MFLVVETVNRNGLDELLTAAIGSDGGVLGMYRTAAVGAGLSNAAQQSARLPGRRVGRPGRQPGPAARPAHRRPTSAPVITPWASLATLLWFERCRWHGTGIPLGRFVGTGLVLSVTATLAATAELAAF